MFCRNCGTKLKDGDKFCLNCGTPVLPVPPAQSAGADGTARTTEIPGPQTPPVQPSAATENSYQQAAQQVPPNQSTATVWPKQTQYDVQKLQEPQGAQQAQSDGQFRTSQVQQQYMGQNAPPQGSHKAKKGLLRWQAVLIAVCAVLVAAAVACVVIFWPQLTGKADINDTPDTVQGDMNDKDSVPDRPPVTDNDAPETDVLTEEEIYGLYGELIRELLSEYGPGRVISPEGAYYSYSGGLITVRLIDFDDDGTNELYCVYSDEEFIYTQAVYGIKDGELFAYLPPESCANNGTDVSPTTNLVEKDGMVYLKEGIHVAIEGDYCTIEDGSWTAVHSYSTPFDMEDEYTVDGVTVTEEEYLDFTEGYDEVERIFYSYFEEDYYADCLEKTDDTLREVFGSDYDDVMAEYMEEGEASQTTPAGDYILPESNTRYLTEEDIAGLSNEELELARNEIYARHGRIFDTDEIREYFESKSWYDGTISPEDFDYSVLSDIERANVNFLLEHEK